MIVMSLNDYLTRRADNGLANFYAYDATLPNGGKIVAHHGRDESTRRYYDNMEEGGVLITYVGRDGLVYRCSVWPGDDTLVKCSKA